MPQDRRDKGDSGGCAELRADGRRCPVIYNANLKADHATYEGSDHEEDEHDGAFIEDCRVETPSKRRGDLLF